MDISWKRTASAEFRVIHPNLCRNCSFPLHFHTRKLGEITVSYAVTKSIDKEYTSTSQQIFERERTNESKIAYNKQRNICVSLLRKTKRDYFANLDTKIMKDNRTFWKTVNSLFSEKSYSKESISLINKDGLVTKNEDLAKTFNIFFSSIVKKLDIEHVPDDESNLLNVEDPILKAIAKYENHPSILRIENYMKEKDLYFSFEFVDKPKISKEINKLDEKKHAKNMIFQ